MKTQADVSDKDKVLKNGSFMEEGKVEEEEGNDSGPNLSMEVLTRIQSALEESRRVREMVAAKINAQNELMNKISAGESTSSSNNNR